MMPTLPILLFSSITLLSTDSKEVNDVSLKYDKPPHII